MKKSMKAYVNRNSIYHGFDDVRIPEIGDTEVLIQVKACALNRRDLRIIEGNYTFKFRYGTIIGSDAAGIVLKVGENVSQEWLGKKVLINPNLCWGENPDTPSKDFSIRGTPEDGVFSQFVAANVDRILKVPDHLTLEEASTLPICGVTAFRMLFNKGKIKKNSNILITGISGGVAQILFEMSKVYTPNIFVSSSSGKHLDFAMKYDVKGAVNYTNQSIREYFRDSVQFDLIFDCAGGDQINDLVHCCKPNGKIIIYGAMNGSTKNFDVSNLYYKQIQLIGTLVGNDSEFRDMVNFVCEHRIKPKIDKVFEFQLIDQAFDRMRSSNHYGKIVLKL